MTKRERIFNAGTSLFAERTYNSVGIRDIAREAEVNSAMISYYFGSKSGLLKEIFTCFSERILDVVKNSLKNSKDQNELLERTVEGFLNDSREHRTLYLVGLRELNPECPQLIAMRETLYSTCWELFADFLDKTGTDFEKAKGTKDIAFTAILSAIFSDYLLGNGSNIDEDNKIEHYKLVVTEILKHGCPSLWQ